MTMPITRCLLSRAGRGDNDAYRELLSRMRVNLETGACSIWPCEHNPPCPFLTRAQQDALVSGINHDLKSKEIES